MDMRLAVIDVETTGLDTEKDHIVEYAVSVKHPGQSGYILMDSLVKPPVPIPPESSAIHHILDDDVQPYGTLEDYIPRIRDLAPPGTICIAHNAAFERAMMPFLEGVKWLCTYKAALRVWPDAPGHSNECLRYWLGYGTGRRVFQRVHSAAHDAQVTSLIFESLWKGATLEDMIQWTNEPALLPTCPIGDYRGWKWAEVPYDFLQWICTKAHSMKEDTLFCARKEMSRRAG